MQITQPMTFGLSPRINKNSRVVSFGFAIKISEKSVPYSDYLSLSSTRGFLSNLKSLVNSKKINSYSFVECIKRAKTLVKYDLILKQCGFDGIKPKLNITKECVAPLAFYDVSTATINLNGFILNKFSKLKRDKVIENALKHELSHVKQFIDIARCEEIGIRGLRQVMKRYIVSFLGVLESEKKLLEQTLLLRLRSCCCKEELLPMYNRLMYIVGEIEDKRAMLRGSKDVLDVNFYQKAIDKLGVIKKGTSEAQKAKSHLNGILRKIYYDTTKVSELEQAYKCGRISKAEFFAKRNELYNSNPLEADSFPFEFNV